MSESFSSAPIRAEKDGESWLIGTSGNVAWIAERTESGLSISSAIPLVFDAYATIVVPEDDQDRARADAVLLRLLSEQSAGQPWWLGYLATGVDDLIFPHVPMVTLYAGWEYVIVEAGPRQAASWRTDRPWKGAMPDLVFPADRTWLLSTLWDDDWRSVGGSLELIQRVVEELPLRARTVCPGEDATPPGHVAR